MIQGEVSSAGVPTVILTIADREWEAIIDTGFNGDLELPNVLRTALAARYIGEIDSLLAGDQLIREDAFHVKFPFDGETVLAETTFVNSGQVLIGTRLLQRHRLEIDFPSRTVSYSEPKIGLARTNTL